MKKNAYHYWTCAAMLWLSVCGIQAQEVYELHLNTQKTGAPVHNTMYGLFFEDINFAADGGLYAEMVKNRSFDFPQNLMAWKTFGKVEIKKEQPLFERNPAYAVLAYAGHDHKHTGLENEGFTGMGFKKGAAYCFSIRAKTVNTAEDQSIRVEFVNTKNDVIGKQDLTITSSAWKKYTLTIRANTTEEKGRLRIFLTTKGAIAVEHVSLFPKDTYKGRENGLRKDLAESLAELKPGIFRFPGGCIVEGTDLATRYNWKNSIGVVENRPVNENRWHYTFPHRFFPDYYQSYGLGFYEFFLLSEDIGAEPLPVLSCGLACQFQNDGEHCHVPVGELDNYIQDALDLIEFANGDVATKWGKIREEMGHPKPFNLKYIGIGNEQWGEEYVDRLEPFVKAIRASDPRIKIVGSSGPSSDGKQFDYLWPEMKRLKVDLVDEHYYKDPEWFLKSASRYDAYDRKAPAVFAGEYACHLPNRANNFYSALCEAAFMTGLERNADLVHMATYAPLFAHVDAWQWRPDMIWFDNLRSVKTPNYYVQQLYSTNKGTHVMTLTMNQKTVAGENGLYASAVCDKTENSYIVKIVNTSQEDKTIRLVLDQVNKKTPLQPEVETIVLKAENSRENTLDNPEAVIPEASSSRLTGNVLSTTLQAGSFTVYKIRY
jgi:alpha-L-arabinofuranosidase